MSSSPASARDAFLATLNLFETGLALMRQDLRRADPDASDEEIDRRRTRASISAGSSTSSPADLPQCVDLLSLVVG